MTSSTAEKTLKWILLLMGGVTCLAFLAVFMPTDWMESANDAMGLGPFQRSPLTEYLARSLATVYGCLGVLTLYVGLNLRRYLDFVAVMGRLTILLGVLLIGIDLWAGMPASWTWGEGPPTLLVGVAFLYLVPRIDREG
jgi:hypothetical protein